MSKQSALNCSFS